MYVILQLEEPVDLNVQNDLFAMPILVLVMTVLNVYRESNGFGYVLESCVRNLPDNGRCIIKLYNKNSWLWQCTQNASVLLSTSRLAF